MGEKSFEPWTRSELFSKYSRSIVDLGSWNETLHEPYIRLWSLMIKQIILSYWNLYSTDLQIVWGFYLKFINANLFNSCRWPNQNILHTI